ncbi:MAG: BMC domain-containing protein [Eubacteriales bacterium]|nr:BMC domain-containing protein [Eubacteriales bacterium]
MAYGAYGLVEVLGDANGVVVLDQMCKAADVKVVAKYTRNGGHCTMIVGGEISAVKAAVDTVAENPPCKVFASGVISGPAEETVRIFSEWEKGQM